MNTIIISARNYARLNAAAINPGPWKARLLPDGRVEIEVDDEVLARLQAINQNMDVAVGTLLGERVT